MKPPVPDRDDELGVAYGESAREMHGVGTPQSVETGQVAGVALDG